MSPACEVNTSFDESALHEKWLTVLSEEAKTYRSLSRRRTRHNTQVFRYVTDSFFFFLWTRRWASSRKDDEKACNSRLKKRKWQVFCGRRLYLWDFLTHQRNIKHKEQHELNQTEAWNWLSLRVDKSSATWSLNERLSCNSVTSAATPDQFHLKMFRSTEDGKGEKIKTAARKWSVSFSWCSGLKIWSTWGSRVLNFSQSLPIEITKRSRSGTAL